MSLLEEGLQESVDVLADEVKRLRRTNTILRTVVGKLRKRNEELGNHSDEIFIALCQADTTDLAGFDADYTKNYDGSNVIRNVMALGEDALNENG